MVILRSQNKITDFFMILAWASPFNFRSDNALHSARKVSDHHKGWTILTILRNALCDELLVPFVRKELGKTSESPATSLNLSPKKFLKYLESSTFQNENYLFCVDIAFEIIQSIFVFREGVRSGN